MKSFAFTLFAVVAAKKDAKESASSHGPSGGLLTVPGVVEFAYDSVMVGKHVVSAATGVTFDAVKTMVPKEQQNLVGDMYNQAYGEVEKLRKQNSIPSATELQGKAGKVWDQVRDQVVTVATQLQDTALKPVQDFCDMMITQMERENSALVGKLPKGNIFDLMLVLFYLTLVFLYVLLPVFCSIFCCGMCSSKKDEPKRSGKMTTAELKAKKRS